MEPFVIFNRPAKTETFFGMLDEYCEEFNIDYVIRGAEPPWKFEIERIQSQRNFLRPIVGGFVQQRERAEFFIDEVLPFFEDGRPTEKETFLEAMKVVEELDDYPLNRKSRSKYTLEYFEKKWSDSL